MKLEWKKLFVIGLAFFTISVAWGVYNSYVPVFLNRLIPSATMVGAIMTIDNVFGLLFQPYFGKKSDTTKTRFGRRMPYMIVGVPLAALFFILIPGHVIGKGDILPLALLMGSIIGMNFFMSVYRAPVVAMMPDATPQPLRAKANGIINFMGGLGSVAAFLVGGALFKQGESLPFFFAAALMLLALFVLMAAYKEPEVPYGSDDESVVSSSGAGLFLSKNGHPPLYKSNKPLIFLLFSIFFWFCGYNGVETFFTLYCAETFGMNEGSAAQLLTFMALSFLIFAIPAGLIGTKLGRGRTMRMGVLVMLLAFGFILLFGQANNLMYALVIAGFGWALININSYPSVASMAPPGETGKYTGFYYAFSFSASIASPILFGVIADLLGSKEYLFLYGCFMFGLAFITLILATTKKKV
jgi:maltose/moltooligosaccharide transporter